MADDGPAGDAGGLDLGCFLDDGVGLWFERGSGAAFAGAPALFLDRDGVVVEEVHYLGRAEDVVMVAGVAEAVARANRSGIAVVLVTNQAGIARGYYDWSGFRAVQAEIGREMALAGARLDLTLACAYHEAGAPPYRVGDHPWRKPRPGMIHRAVSVLGIDPARSLIVGDRLSDLQAGRSAGLAAGALTLTGHGADEARATRAWIAAEPASRFAASIVPSAPDAILRWLEDRAP